VTDARAFTLHVESVGRGRPLVLLHGWALHAGLFTPLLPALAQRHRVLAADLPGHGHSAPLADWSLDAVVAALQHMCADAGEVDVLGWSLGGLVALAWTHAHPARVRKLVLVGTTPKFVTGGDWPHAMAAGTMRRFADELRVAYRPTLQRFLTLQVQGSDEGRATLAALRHALHARGAPDPSVLSGALHVLADTDVRGLVPSIRQPTLVIAGERDTLAPPEASAWLARTLPDACLTVIPGAGHAPFLSHPAAFLAAVQPFLQA
jgi:pimeloyl-[acyl-carrier protein] methyl ester esterase